MVHLDLCRIRNRLVEGNYANDICIANYVFWRRYARDCLGSDESRTLGSHMGDLGADLPGSGAGCASHCDAAPGSESERPGQAARAP